MSRSITFSSYFLLFRLSAAPDLFSRLARSPKHVLPPCFRFSQISSLMSAFNHPALSLTRLSDNYKTTTAYFVFWYIDTYVQTYNMCAGVSCVVCLMSSVMCHVSCVVCLVSCVVCLRVSSVECIVPCVVCLVSCVVYIYMYTYK